MRLPSGVFKGVIKDDALLLSDLVKTKKLQTDVYRRFKTALKNKNGQNNKFQITDL